ncbi:MAG: hypothetical protein ABWZ78_17630, partial [Burkholderiaceae bacterium]
MAMLTDGPGGGDRPVARAESPAILDRPATLVRRGALDRPATLVRRATLDCLATWVRRATLDCVAAFARSARHPALFCVVVAVSGCALIGGGDGGGGDRPREGFRDRS